MEFFEKHVRPLLVKRCFECHGGTKAGGGLSLATAKGWKQGGESGPAVVPGSPEESLLIEAVEHRSLEMPPPARGGKLPEEEARAWWSFQPLPSAEPLETRDIDTRDIDAMLEREWPARKLVASPPADKRTNTAEHKGREHHPWAFNSWLAGGASSRASSMARPTRSACGPSRSRSMYGIFMPRSCT